MPISANYTGPRVTDLLVNEPRILRELQNFNQNDIKGWKEPPSLRIRRLAPPGFKWKKKYKWSSEFNSDRSANSVSTGRINRWTTENKWRGRFPSIFRKQNVSLEDNVLVLHAKEISPDEEFLKTYKWVKTHRLNKNQSDSTKGRLAKGRKFWSTAFIKTVAPVTYGYIEIACKLGDSTLSSAFWLKEHEGTRREIDIFEYSTSPKKFKNVEFSKYFLTNVHNFTNPAKRGESTYERSVPIKLDKNLSKEEVIKVGLLWTDKELSWFLNDDLVRKVKHNGLFKNVKMHVTLDREYLSWFGEPDEDDELGAFKIYYCRCWQLEKKIGSRLKRSMRRVRVKPIR